MAEELIDHDVPDDYEEIMQEDRLIQHQWYHYYMIAIQQAAGPGYDWVLPEW